MLKSAKIALSALAMLVLSINHTLADGVLRADDLSFVPVFKDEDALDKFSALARAGNSYEGLLLYVACIVENGTPAAITDLGFSTHTIIVTSGPNIGCTGEIFREDYEFR